MLRVIRNKLEWYCEFNLFIFFLAIELESFFPYILINQSDQSTVFNCRIDIFHIMDFLYSTCIYVGVIRTDTSCLTSLDVGKDQILSLS